MFIYAIGRRIFIVKVVARRVGNHTSEKRLTIGLCFFNMLAPVRNVIKYYLEWIEKAFFQHL